MKADELSLILRRRVCGRGGERRAGAVRIADPGLPHPTAPAAALVEGITAAIRAVAARRAGVEAIWRRAAGRLARFARVAGIRGDALVVQADGNSAALYELRFSLPRIEAAVGRDKPEIRRVILRQGYRKEGKWL